MKLIISFLFTFIIFVAFGPQAQAQTSDTEAITVSQSASESTTIAVKVRGVGCGSDVALIRANVEKLTGVEKCAVVKHGAITSFDVTYNAEKAVLKDIYAAIEDTGCCKDPDARPYKVKL